MKDRWLVTAACIAVLLFVGYFFLGEIAGFFAGRDVAMKRHCTELSKMARPENKARYGLMLENMDPVQKRIEQRRVEACREYWLRGTINLADTLPPAYTPPEFEERLWAMPCHKAVDMLSEGKKRLPAEQRALWARVDECRERGNR